MIGKTISHYKLLEKLGEGGMGVVYKAEDTKLKRTVTLKFIKPQVMQKTEEKTRFLREAQAAAALDHPNICTIYEIDDVKGQTFIAMAYIKGQSLQEKIESAPLKLEEVLDIGMQVAQGLQEAHEKGVVHRDIKTSNIMVTDKGQAKIMDFGIAKLAEGTKLTKTATIMGTVAYMSPEQAFAEPVDHRTDIWSLGVVIYEMLTGQSPFQGEYQQVVLHSILNKNPQPITSLRSGVPLGLEAIVNKCLEKDPSERYQTAADLNADLKRLKRDMTSGKAAVRFPTPAVPYPFPRLLRKIALPLSGVILVLLFLLFLPSSRQVLKKWLGFGGIPEEKHLAVLPFTVVGGTEVDQAFCDGLVETLTSKLIQMENFQESFWVVSARDVHESKTKSPEEARKALGVNLAVTGRMKRIGDLVSLTLELFNTKTLSQLDSEDITDHIANLFTWQDDVLIKLLQMLDIEPEPQARRLLAIGSTTIPAAYESYLKGLGFMQHYENEESLDTAINSFKQAIEQDSSYAVAHEELGKAYWEKYKLTKDPDLVKKAQSSCKKAIDISDSLVSVHVTLGIIYRDTGQYEDAIKELKQALQLDPENYDATLELATAYEEVEKFTEAEEKYKEAIKLRERDWRGCANLGIFYYYNARYAEAEEMFLKVTELSPGDISGYNYLGATYIKMERREEAAAMFKKSLAIKANDVAFNNLGHIYFFQGLYADAMTMFEEAIKFGEDDYAIWGNLADARRYTPGYSEKALEAYQRAIQLAEEQLAVNPNDALIRSRLAAYFAKSGNYKKALDEISRALNLKPNDVEILLKSVLVYELSKQRDHALKAFQEYIERGGSTEEVSKDPYLSELRTDPRYQKLIKREGSTRSDSSGIT